MGKILVLAEKPSVGRELARVLGCKKNNNGYISGDRYIVTWALGHLVTLCDPEHYGKQYKTWNMETLPMLPAKMDLEVIPATAKQYSVVKTLLRSSEVSSIIIATDAGREGELVARWIIAKAGCNKPIKRLWISSQTDKAIKQGFASLKDGKEYFNLYQSAQSRAEADWLVGLNVTRGLTCKYNAQLSAGRVQTPTLAIIVAREKEIKEFVPRDYYTLHASLNKFFVTYANDKNQSAIWDKDKADAIAKKVSGKQFTVSDVKVTPKRVPPPALYDLTELQRDGNRLFGFSAKQTLSIMQSLYEQHKALTYPRTDSRYLTDDIVPTLTDRIKAIMVGDYMPIAKEVFSQRKSIAPSCINNAKVSDHHAIIPTEQRVNMSDLSNEERRIYSLVVKRFLTCFFPAYEYKGIRATFTCEGEKFFAVGREVVNKGWKKVSDNNDDVDDDEQILPSLPKGEKIPCHDILVKSAKTKPPARYTEATLLSAMENPSAFIADKDMKEYIGGGLGTPATRADIIEKLFASFNMEKQGQSIIPTAKGIQLIELVPADLKEPLLTAKWEKQLDAISKGTAAKSDFIRDIRAYTTALVKTVANSEENYVHHNMTNQACPDCGKMMLAVNGKKGKMMVCQDRNCGHRENVSMQSRARCPQCHKFMEMRGDGDKRTYRCICGYRENQQQFDKRVGNSSGSASKKAVQDYMQNQKKADTGESALALALKQALQKKD